MRRGKEIKYDKGKRSEKWYLSSIGVVWVDLDLLVIRYASLVIVSDKRRTGLLFIKEKKRTPA